MLVASLDVGGAETHIVELCRTLAGLGHRVIIASSGGRLCSLLDGIPHIDIDLATRSPIGLLRSYASLLRSVRRIKPDLIHSHSRIASFLGERVARKQNICFVTTVHAKFSVNKLSARLSRWGYYSTAVSDDLAIYLCDNYTVSSDRISVIGNGVDTERFSKKGEPKNRIVFVSRLDTDCSRAAYALCRISERLSRRYSRLEIRIVGGGSEYDKIRSIAERINKRSGYNAVVMSGTTNDVACELSGALLFIGVGRCAIEAMSSAIPTIVAGNEGYFGILNENNTAEAASGNFCARGYEAINDKRLYDDVCTLLDMKREQRERLGAYLRSFAIGHNSITESAKETAAFYKRAYEGVLFEPYGVCLCGYYGYGNTGDDTLLERAVIRAKERYKDIGICALTHSRSRARYRFSIPCFNRYSLLSLIRAVARCRVLVFGGGTLFQDRTSLRSMLYYSSVALLGFLFGKRVELWGNGLSEPKHALSKLLLRAILKRAIYVGVRDKPSFNIALGYGAESEKVHLEGDLALTIKKEECKVTPSTRAILNRVGRYALFSIRGTTNDAEYGYFKERANAAAEKGISVISVAMYPAEDRQKSRRFTSEVGGIYAEGLSASELVFLLSRAEFCLSARLHLLIFAKIADTPFESVGNDPKLTAFCRENG